MATKPKRGGSSGYERSRGGGSGGSNITPAQRERYERADYTIDSLGKTRIDRGVTVDAGGDVGRITIKADEGAWDYTVNVTSKDGTRSFSESSQERTRDAAKEYARSLIPVDWTWDTIYGR